MDGFWIMTMSEGTAVLGTTNSSTVPRCEAGRSQNASAQTFCTTAACERHFPPRLGSRMARGCVPSRGDPTEATSLTEGSRAGKDTQGKNA